VSDGRAIELIKQVGEIALVGNIIPHSWYTHLRKDSGKPYLAAIVILSDIAYWYRPRLIRDEVTGQVLRVEKRFKADKLQRSYQQIADLFGLTKRQVREAVRFLEAQGVVTREFRTVRTKGGMVLSNVLFLEPVVDRLREITTTGRGVTQKRHTYDEKTPYPPRENAIPMTEKGGTYTEITTEKNDDDDGPARAAASLSPLALEGDQVEAYCCLRCKPIEMDSDQALKLAQACDLEAVRGWCCVAWARHGPGGVTKPAGFVWVKLTKGVAAPDVAPAQMREFMECVDDYRLCRLLQEAGRGGTCITAL